MRKIVINKTKNETQVAILEDDKLVELHIDNEDEMITGNIYSGIIKNKLKGMDAYFVDIGKERNGYLAVSENDISRVKSKDAVLVQVKKDETGEKGAYLTLDISINGKYMVLLPYSKGFNFSKKMESEDLKNKLKALIERINVKEYGVIFRSDLKEDDIEVIELEYKQLCEKWDKIYNDYLYRKAPEVLHKQGLVEKVFNNMVTSDTIKIISNDENIYNEFVNANKIVKEKIEIYEDDKLSILDFYKIESQIEKALNNRVWLKNGGELRIDKTEAMTVIDIDTSKFIGKKNMEQTALRVNKEAAIEIARQIRLRNISGIIIIDFINMKKQADKDEVLNLLREQTKKDSVTTMVLGMTKLGLVEMTRQKSKKSLDELYKQICPVCQGRGNIDSINMIVNKIEEKLTYMERETIYEKIIIEAHEMVMKKLTNSQVLKKTRLKTMLKSNKNARIDEWKVEKKE